MSHAPTCPDAEGGTLETDPSGWLHKCIEVEARITAPVLDAPSVDASERREGKTRQTPTPDTRSLSDQEVYDFLSGLGRKVVPGDVTPALSAWAVEWAKKYEGTFAFMQDMKAAAQRGRLSIGMVKGVLNCAAADIRHGKFRPEGEPEPAPAASKSAAPTRKVSEDGMYRLPDGAIYKVQWALDGGHLYAKRLVDKGGRGSFEYEPGALRKIGPEHKMTLDEAKQFGHLYGFCCVCARRLTNEASIEAGIGPICAEKF